MKKCISTITLVLILLASTNSNAQLVKKGDIIGGLNISGQKYGSLDSNGSYKMGSRKINVAPFISYGIKNNLTIGAYLLLNNSNGNLLNFGKYNHDYAVAVFARKYLPVTKRLYGYVQGDIKYATMGGIYNTGRFNTNSFSFNLSGGIGYKFSPKFGIEIGMNNLVTAEISRNKGYFSNGTYSNIKNSNLTLRNIGERNGFHIGVVFKFK